MVEVVMVKLHPFTQCFLSHVGPTSPAKLLPEKVSYFVVFRYNTLILFLSFLSICFSYWHFLVWPIAALSFCPNPWEVHWNTALHLNYPLLAGEAQFGLSSFLCNSQKFCAIRNTHRASLVALAANQSCARSPWPLDTELGARGEQEGPAPSQDTSVLSHYCQVKANYTLAL